MNNLLNLYSQYNYSKEETDQNRKRNIIAIVVAVIIHVLLIVIFGGNILEISRPKEEIKVINVQLLESVQKQATLTPKEMKKSKKKEQPKENTQKKSKDIKQEQAPATKQQHSETKKPVEQVKPTEQPKPVAPPITEKQETKQTETAKSETTTVAEDKTETTIDDTPKPYTPPKSKKSSAFDKFAKNNNDTAESPEWANADEPQNTEDEDLQQMQDALKSIKAHSDEKGKKKSSASGDEVTQSGSPDGEIKWNGSSRHLKSAGGIKAPEEISKSGLKTSITLRFEVYPSGLIGQVDILQSTGETNWDNYIVNQFKSNYKFDIAEKHAVGEITIQIGAIKNE